MNFHFYRYFFTYVFKSKTRQRLLFIAVVGLLLSSFSLVVLQGIMGGLQNGLILRSKKVLGHGHIEINNRDEIEHHQLSLDLIDRFQEKGILFYPEYHLELMLKHDRRVSPVILHGIDYSYGTPPFLIKKDTEGTVLASDLSSKLNAYYNSNLSFISPAHLDSLFGDVPRQVSSTVSDFYMSELTEIDAVHAWSPITLVQNLVRKRNFNRIIFFDEDSLNFASDLLKTSTFNDPIYKIYTWEQKNKTLVWALKLETNVMLFLFIGMSFLVAICITSGFMIFFDKIKTDLISFWILGKSQKEVLNLSYVFTHMISFLFCSLGVMLGLGFLYFLKSNTISFMPDFFVERNIPVKIDTLKVLISFIIPYLISVVFSYFSFSLFKKDTSSFVKIIRNVG